MLAPYLENLLGKLVSLLLGGQRIVQEQVGRHLRRRMWDGGMWDGGLRVVEQAGPPTPPPGILTAAPWSRRSRERGRERREREKEREREREKERERDR